MVILLVFQLLDLLALMSTVTLVSLVPWILLLTLLSVRVTLALTLVLVPLAPVPLVQLDNNASRTMMVVFLASPLKTLLVVVLLMPLLLVVTLLNALVPNSSLMDVLVNAPSKLLTVSHVLKMAEFFLEIVLPLVVLMKCVLLHWVQILLVSLNLLLLLPLALVSP